MHKYRKDTEHLYHAFLLATESQSHAVTESQTPKGTQYTGG